MMRMMTLMMLTLTLLFTTSVHAYHRGERRITVTTSLTRSNVRGRRGRFLQMEKDTEPEDDVEDAMTPAPSNKPTTAMIAPSSAPSLAPSPAPEPSAFPSRPLAPASAYSVNLLEFVVWTNNTNIDTMTTLFSKLLKKAFKKEFDSFYAVDLQLLNLQISGRRRVVTDVFVYAGTATFDGVVSNTDVLQLQTKTLEDLKSIQEYSPRVEAVSVAAIDSSTNNTSPSSSPPSSQTSSSSSSSSFPSSTVFLAAAIAMVCIVLALVAYFGYRYYRPAAKQPLSPHDDDEDVDNPDGTLKKNNSSVLHGSNVESDLPDDVSRSVFSYDARNTESDDYSASGISSSYSETADLDNIQVYLAHQKAREAREGSVVDALSTADSEESDLDNTQLYLAKQRKKEEKDDEDDVVSHDESSATDSEPGLNITTQRYLEQRRKQKELQQQQPQKTLMASKTPVVLYESDADCSYDYVGRKGMESDDDDLYMTDNEPVEVGGGGSAAYVTGYYGTLGRDNDEEDGHHQVKHPRGDVLMHPRTANQLNIQRVPSYKKSADDDDDDNDYGDDEEEYAVSPRRLKKRTEVKDVDKENASSLVRPSRRKTNQSTTTRNQGVTL